MIYAKLSAAVFFWGLTFLVTKTALNEAGLTTVVFMRCVLGLAVVSLFVRDFKWLKHITRAEWVKFTFLGLIGIVIQQLAQGYAVLHTSISHAGWLNALSPVVVAFVMVMFFGEKLPKDKMMGFVICALGVLLVFISKQMLSDGSVMPTSKGDIIMISTGLNWVIYVIPLGLWFKNTPNLRVTFCILLTASVLMLPLEIFGGAYKNLADISPRTWISLIYLGVFCSGFALIFYNEGIEKIGVSKASAFIYAQPFVTMAAGFLFFGERLSRETVIGGSLMLCGLYLINVPRHHFKKFYITLIRYFRV